VSFGESTIEVRCVPRDLKFYCAWFCPFAQRVWIALEEKKLPYQYIECELYEKPADGRATKRSLSLEEKARRNPNGFMECCPRGLVPGLNNSGSKVYESMVCLEYLDEAFPDSPQLLPKDPLQRAKVKIWTNFVQEKVIATYYRLLMSQETDSRDLAKKQLISALEEVIGVMAPLSEGPFFSGQHFGLFEVTFAPWCQRFFSVLQEYRGFCLSDTTSMQRLVKWYEACCQRTSFAATVVSRERLIQNNSGYADNTATSTVAQNTRAGAGVPVPLRKDSPSINKSTQAPSFIPAVVLSAAVGALLSVFAMTLTHRSRG